MQAKASLSADYFAGRILGLGDSQQREPCHLDIERDGRYDIRVSVIADEQKMFVVRYGTDCLIGTRQWKKEVDGSG